MVCQKILNRCLPIVVTGLLVTSVSANAMALISPGRSLKTRLIVLTDMSSVKAGVREPDDAQSMIRLMLYSDDFDIEGLIAGSGLRHGHVVRPQNIRKIVDAYGKVRPNLILHDKNYPTADSLRKTIKSGQPNADEGMPVHKSIGRGKDTQASRWIIKMVDKPDIRPVWITIWGGSADLAQALWKVRQTRSHEQVERFIGKIRVLASGDQDSTGPWIKSNFPNMYYMTSHGGGRGMYRGGDQRLVSSEWVQKNIKGHGALGNLYPDYRGGDIWSYKLGQVKGIKSGDSSQFMGLIHNGLNVPGRLTLENWGGRNKRDADNPHHYHNAIDKIGDYRNDPSPFIAAVYRWRPDFQAEYAARLDWSVKSYDQANHAPLDSNGGTGIVDRDVKSGEKVKLQSGKWSDPDDNRLNFHWQMLTEESTYPRAITIFSQYPQPGKRWKILKGASSYSRSAEFTAPPVDRTRSIHVLLKVTDNGSPALSSYKRYNITVHP